MISFGTVSQGTLRTEDLLEAFANELDYQLSHGWAVSGYGVSKLRALVDEARNVDPDRLQVLTDKEYSEFANELVNELQDALCELAPPYVYFGNAEGDGSDFGFWPDIRALEYAVICGEVMKLDAGDEIPADYTGEVMFVNDHGNISFGYVDESSRNFVELWAVV